MNADQLASRVAHSMLAAEGTGRAWGIVLEEARAGYCRLTMEVRADMLNGHGSAHGGMIFALADTAFAYVCNGANSKSVAAWLGLVPRQNSSGGKERLGGITKAGDTYLRKMLFVGAMAVIRHAERFGTRKPWLIKLLSRRSPRVAAIALANKIGRTAWALMTSGERYREPAVVR